MARKKYDEAFRAEAVRLVREGRRNGQSIERVSKNLGVHSNTLREWLRHDDLVHAGDGTNTANLDPASEVEQLRKEIRLLKMEREILKKATALFAKDSS
jgi:transposase